MSYLRKLLQYHDITIIQLLCHRNEPLQSDVTEMSLQNSFESLVKYLLRHLFDMRASGPACVRAFVRIYIIIFII